MITVVVLAKNEEKRISKCLAFLNWADEIVVIDDNSTDKTRKIARSLGARVYKRSLNDDFASQRNQGLSLARMDWVFFVDADEYVSKKMATEIQESIVKSDCEGYCVFRKDNFLGRMMQGGDWGNHKLLRLGKKDAGRWEREVHETWRLGGKIGQINTPLLHFPFNSVGEFVESVNRYSVLHAMSNKKEGKNASFVKIIIMPFGKFIVNFFLKRGYADGTRGFVYSIMMSFHSFLSWSQQWLSSQNQKSKIY